VTDERFIRVPARARQELGELTVYLEEGLRSLRQVTEHLRGTSGTMPGVLDDLREVMRMTEAATERVLDETEALVDDGRAAARLVADVRRSAAGAGATAIAEPMQALGTLIQRSNDRAMEIMAALEFQDLTSQKVQRTFVVLEEVLVRLGKIQRSIEDGGPETGPPNPPTLRARNESAPSATADRPRAGGPRADGPRADGPRADGPRGTAPAQRLADELSLHYATNMDV
jgi:chemotaxis regulatin CheY-phosphate phosphatase CheZ